MYQNITGARKKKSRKATPPMAALVRLFISPNIEQWVDSSTLENAPVPNSRFSADTRKRLWIMAAGGELPTARAIMDLKSLKVMAVLALIIIGVVLLLLLLSGCRAC